MFKSYSLDLAGKTLTVEIGRVCAQANGAAILRYDAPMRTISASDVKMCIKTSGQKKAASENSPDTPTIYRTIKPKIFCIVFLFFLPPSALSSQCHIYPDFPHAVSSSLSNQ